MKKNNNSTWQKVKLGDFIEINPRVSLVKGKEYPFIDMADIQPLSRSTLLTKNKIFNGSGTRFEKGDTLFARITPCLENGKITQVLNIDKPGFGSTEFIVLRGKKGISDSNFIHYLSRTYRIRKLAEQSMIGASGRQRVERDAFENIDIEVPKDIKTQSRVASTLSAFDDKIELNNKINAILEKMAQAIFKEWFVNFEFPTSPPPDKGETEGVLFIPYNPKLKEFARENRKNPTVAERKMWKILSGKQFENLKFTRQKPLDNFIADFYCASLRLVIEIDGDSHRENQEYDKLRSDILKEKYGIGVIRYANDEIINNIEGVYEDLVERIKTHPSPPFSGRGYRRNGGEMVDSELGKVPKGWGVKMLFGFGKVITGKTPLTKDPENFDGTYPFITIPDIQNIYITNTERTLSDKARDSMENLLLPSGAICVSCIATVGKVGITIQDSFTNQQINSIIPKKDIYVPYLFFKLKNMKKDLELYGSGGTATLIIKKSQFEKIEVVMPSEQILEKYYEIVNPMLKTIKNNIFENISLANLRDLFLPKLMKGEVRV